MITSFSIKNFKSYRDAEMHLAPLTLFIGANASGKSNALEAIRLLSWLARGSRLDDIEGGGIKGTDLLLRGQTLDLFRDVKKGFELGCRIEDIEGNRNRLSLEIGLIADHLAISNESVSNDSELLPLYRVDSKPGAHTDEIKVEYNNFQRGENKPHIPCSNRQAIFYQLETPARFNKNHEKSQKIIPSVVRGIREALRNIVFLDPRPAEMRDYSYAKDDRLKEDGSNLSSVLYKIWTGGGSRGENGAGDPADREKLLEFVRSLPEQDIKDISFIRTARNDVMVRLVESFGNRENVVDAPMLSDGTLRVLAVGAMLLTAPRGALVIIEEIDNGIHPSRAEGLVRQIRKISMERDLKVLLTSHNPALLDALPDDSLGDVLCCYRDPEEGDSRIVRLSDLDRYPELVAQGPLGQLMARNVLDRFIKDRTTEEERKYEALSWLNELKKEVSE